MIRAGTTARLTRSLRVPLIHMINKDVHRFLCLGLACLVTGRLKVVGPFEFIPIKS